MTHLNAVSSGGLALYNMGINYHDFGIVRNKDKTKFGDYFKVDCLTKEQKQALQNSYSNVCFKNIHSEFAPELKKCAIVFKTKAQIKRENLS